MQNPQNNIGAGAIPLWRTDGVQIANVYEWPTTPTESDLVGRTVALVYSTDLSSLIYSTDGENWQQVGTGGGGAGVDTDARLAIGWPYTYPLSIGASIGDWQAEDENGFTISQTIGPFTPVTFGFGQRNSISNVLSSVVSLVGTGWAGLNASQNLYVWMNDWNANNGAQTVNQVVASKAPLASPALTGVPTAPTAALGTNTTQIATTAFVLANSGGAFSPTNGYTWTAPQTFNNTIQVNAVFGADRSSSGTNQGIRLNDTDYTSIFYGSNAIQLTPTNINIVASNTVNSVVNITGGLVTSADIESTPNNGGLILKSPNGTRYRITVANDGSLTTTAV